MNAGRDDLAGLEYFCPQVHPVLRNGKRFKKAVFATLHLGAKYKRPPLIHNGRKARV